MSQIMRERQINIQGVVQALVAWHSSEEGQGLVEYGLLASFISIAAIAAIALVGPFLQSMFAYIISQLSLA